MDTMQTVPSVHNIVSQASADRPISNLDFVIYPHAIPSPTPLSVKDSGVYSYFGPCLSLASLPSALHNWELAKIDGDLMTPLKAVLEWVHSFESERASEMDHYRLAIRATQVSDKWDIPMWHTDVVWMMVNSAGLFDRIKGSERGSRIKPQNAVCKSLMSMRTNGSKWHEETACPLKG